MQHRQPAAAITAFPALSCHSKDACAACMMMKMMHLCAQREHLYCACPRSRLLLPAHTQRCAARAAIPTHLTPQLCQSALLHLLHAKMAVWGTSSTPAWV
jgi:hypothetical protein